MSESENSVFLFNKESINKIELISNGVKIQITNDEEIKNILACFDDDAKIYSQFYQHGGCCGIHWKNSFSIILYNNSESASFGFYDCDMYYKSVPLKFLLYNSDNPDDLKYMKYSAFFSYIVKYNQVKLTEVLKEYNIDSIKY